MKKTLLAALLCGTAAWALPENGQIIQGQIQMAQPNANILQIMQSSPTGIINWGSFNIDVHQLVQFLQPNSSAATLNRVIGQEPSQILGQLQANGRILLINPNGILFGPGSVVDTGSFLASTLSIQDQDFLQGRYDLHWDGTSPLRAVVNQGEIRVSEGGFLALVSPMVDNQGLLVAERGQVVLGATRQASLTVDARGLLQVVIPDGFQGGSTHAPGAVLLTAGQMSDTLAQLVNHYGGSEAGAIVDTGHGIQLVSGEGLLVNQGSIRTDAAHGDAGSVLLNSSQATVLAPGSLVSAQAQAGNGGEIRALSAGYTRQQGELLANSLSGGNGGFVEVSAPHVAMTRGADVSALQGTAGVFLLDPDNVFIRVGGTDPPNQPFGAPGSGDIFVDPSALDTAGTVTLQANQSIIFDAGVQVDLNSNTDLRLQALQNIVMNAGSAINAVNPNSSVTMQANGSVDLTTLNIATSHIQGGTFVRFNGGNLGLAGSPSLVNVSAPSVSFADASTNQVNGSVVNFNSQGGGDFLLGDNARLNLSGTTSNNLTVAAGGVGINPGSTLTASGPSSLNFNSTAGVFNMGAGSSINSANAGSVLNVTATGSVDLSSVGVPTTRATSGTFARFDGGTVGVAGMPTVVNVVGQTSVNVQDNNTTNLVGTTVDLDLNSPGTVAWGTNATLNTGSGVADVNVTAASINFSPTSQLISQGPTQLHFNASQNFFTDNGTRISAPAGSVAGINATGSATLHSLEVPTSHINAGSFVQFNSGTLGQPGSDTLVNVTAGDGIFVFAGSTLNVVGDRVEMDLLATSNSVFFGDTSLTQLQGQTSNVLHARSDNNLLYLGQNTRINSNGPSDLRFATASNTILQRDGGSIQVNGAANVSMVAGVNVILQPTSGISASGAGSRLDVSATHDVSFDGNAAVPIVNVTAGNGLDIQGTMGRAGSPVQIDQRGLSVSFFNTTVNGSQIDWNLTSTGGDIVQINSTDLVLAGNNNHVNWNANQNILFGTNTTLTSEGPTQMLLTSGARTIQLTNSSIALPNAGSNLDISSALSPAFSRVQVGGRLAVTATGGNNIRVANQLLANDIVLTSPGQLLDDRTDNVPAIVAQSSLNVTVANISGPLTDPSIGLVQALPFATGPNAHVRFNLTGPNNTTLGERSANLFYAYPQSGDIVILHPQSQVALYNEPAPPVAAAPRGIQTREDFSPQQFQEVSTQTAQSQLQLSSLYSVADLPSVNDVLLLDYDNPGLTNSFATSYMVSAVVERVVLSPELAMQNRVQREKRESERPTSLVLAGNDEDEQLLYWRRLIEGLVIWEDS